MSASTVGIFLSVLMTVYNNFLSPERTFVKVVGRYERNLFRLWSRCDNNRLPQEIADFNENRDPIEALAELSVDKVIAASQHKAPTKGRQNPSTPPAPDKTQAA
jgi:hypothetical protein